MDCEEEAFELLLIEEADAWFEYLESITEVSELRYHEVEPWAWSRLDQRILGIRSRRARLEATAV